MKKAVEAILKPSGSPAARRAAGVNLERKKGSGKSRLDNHIKGASLHSMIIILQWFQSCEL